MKKITIADVEVNALTESDAALITPDIARQMVDVESNNYRKLSPNQVVVFSKMMKNGEWHFNGDTLALTRDGKTPDGQHRQHACISSDISFKTILVDTDKDENMDMKRKLNFNAILHGRGYKNPNPLGAMIKLMYMWDNGYKNCFFDHRPVDNNKLSNYFDSNPDLLNSFNFCTEYHSKSGIPHSKLAAFYHIAKRLDLNMANEFVMLLGVDFSKYPMMGISPHNSLYKLKQIFSKITPEKKLRLDYKMALVIKAWNSWRSGEPVYNLIWRVNGAKPEEFPTIN